jgi:hypothetical protein
MVVFGYYLRGGLLNLHIELDELHFTSIYNVEEDTSIINEPPGNTLRKITFTIRYQGLELMDQIASVLKKSFTFKRTWIRTYRI